MTAFRVLGFGASNDVGRGRCCAPPALLPLHPFLPFLPQGKKVGQPPPVSRRLQSIPSGDFVLGDEESDRVMRGPMGGRVQA